MQRNAAVEFEIGKEEHIAKQRIDLLLSIDSARYRYFFNINWLGINNIAVPIYEYSINYTL